MSENEVHRPEIRGVPVSSRSFTGVPSLEVRQSYGKGTFEAVEDEEVTVCHMMRGRGPLMRWPS